MHVRRAGVHESNVIIIVKRILPSRALPSEYHESGWYGWFALHGLVAFALNYSDSI